jgi:tRNA1(Val) A37 N6-methylase TrmN6
VSGGSKFNDSSYKVIARHEVCLNLDQLFLISKKLLKNGGVISIVHRPDRLVDILTIMRNNNIEPKRIRFVYPKVGRECNMILVEGSKNGKPGLKILPPLVTHNADGSYSSEVLSFFEG